VSGFLTRLSHCPVAETYQILQNILLFIDADTGNRKMITQLEIHK
jgi:hypothetical protein